MNPTEVSNLQAAFAYQSEMLKGYQEQLTKLQSVNVHLTRYIRSLPTATLRTVSVALPYKFDNTTPAVRTVKQMPFPGDMISLQKSLAPESILSPSVNIAPVSWDIMAELQREQHLEPPPANCPPDKQYVPLCLSQRVMQWVHASISVCHPRISCTLRLLQN